MFKTPSIGYERQISSFLSLKSLAVPSGYACVFCLGQYKICSLSLNHGNLNIFLSLIILPLSLISCQHRDAKTEVKPQRRNITESVYASVKVSPETAYYVQSVRNGIIDRIYIKEGELVKEDQLLVQIVAPVSDKVQLNDAEISLEEAKSNLKGQNSLLNNIELEIQSIKEQSKLDSINLERQERLLSQNIGKSADYEQLKLKYDNSKTQLELLRQKLEQTKTTLEVNYKKAINKINSERNQLADFQIRARMDGRVYSINKEEGDFVSTQEKIAEIGSYDKFKIAMDIDEVDIIKINLRDSVLIILDAYPDEVFVANVSKIYAKKDDITQTFRVESTFQQLPPKLYYGLSGEANIIVAKRENTLVIPTAYLLPNHKVLTTEGEKTVTVGMRNLEYTEILSGIDTTSTLIKPGE